VYYKFKGGEKIRKQMIFLALAMVFAMIICGSVSAANTTMGGELDSEIALNISLEHPEALSGNNLPSVSVKDSNGNSISNISVTKSGNSQYKINFKSNKTSLKVNVTALGHISQLVNVQMNWLNSTNSSYGSSTVNLRAYNLLILSGSSTYSKPVVYSNRKLREEGYYYNLKFFTTSDLTSGNTTIENEIKEFAQKSDIIILEMIGISSVNKIKELINGTNATIWALRSNSTFNNVSYIDSNDTQMRIYWDNSGEENMGRFQLKTLQKIGMYVDPSQDLSPVFYPKVFIYHPDSPIASFTTFNDYLSWYSQNGTYNASAPWVGILGYKSHFMNGNGELLQALLRSLEEKGMNVMLVICDSNDDARASAFSTFFMNGNSSRINALVCCMGYTMVLSNATASAEILEKLNVPVFAPIYASDLDTWENSSSGLSSEVYWQVAWPEMEGRIEPILMGGVESSEIDPFTGISIKKYTPIPDRIERVTSRVVTWVDLQILQNSAKKIALIYYNTAGGKDGVGASYLNVPESISQILKAMDDAGYTVNGNYSVESIISLFLTAGNNVGSWAPGELKKLVDAGAITIPLSDYQKWFATLPQDLQNEVIAKWGPTPGNVMVYDGKIVIPGIMLGNIFVGAQPMRGWGEDPTSIAHSATLPPTHQYIAFYMWLQNSMKANAVIHLGTHGTLEWLPGRSVGLGIEDWPDVLLGNMPNIYPYIMDNTGEGTQAKRRGYAVIIDHLTATLVNSGLYGDLSTLKDKISSYDSTDQSDRKAVLQSEILGLIKSLNLNEDLNIDLNSTSFEDIKNKVEHHLEEIESSLIPYGLHTFGVALNGTELEQMIDSIVSFDIVNRNNTEYRNYLRSLLTSNLEVENLLTVLNGNFVSPSLGGDPIRKGEEVLPTGLNFYSFDPRMAPDSTAWKIGSQMADEMLAQYYAVNGKYPETVGIVLWSTETMRTMGQSIAMILRYMGLEPTYDTSKRFTGYNITSLADLKRPRIDVLVTISGLFRDTFSYTTNVLDNAFRQVANLSESIETNYIRKHYLTDLANYTQIGMNSTIAQILAGSRIFGPPAEAYGTGVAQLIPSTSGWDNQSALVEAYLSKMSYIYGNGIYALNGIDALKNQLKNVDATIQVRDNNYGLLDNDDVYQYLGGLTMTAESISNKDISVYIANTRGTPRIETLGQFMSTEIHSRILNPKWKEGMLNEGFSGANEIANEIGHLFAWEAVIPESVSDETWKSIAENYILDSSVKNQFLKANPYAFASTAAWILEAARRGMISMDAATQTAVANEYIKATVDYGVVCCHHTCANLEFNKWVAKVSSASSATLKAYAKIMQAATGKDIGLLSNDPSTPSQGGSSNGENGQSSSNEDKGQSSSSNSQSSASTQSKESSDSSASESTTGSSNSQQKAYEVTKNPQGSSDSTGVSFFAILGIIGLLGLFGVGYYRKNV
jgi:cobaltochelatase CobN